MYKDVIYKWFGLAVAVAGFVASIAYAASVGDRLNSPVLVGQGTAVSEFITFDTGNGSSNAQLSSDASGNMSGRLGSGTFTGGSTFSGNLTFSGQPVFSGITTTIQGHALLTGSTTITEPLLETGSHATGLGTALEITNSSTGQSTKIYSGSGNGSPTIQTVTNDDIVLSPNSSEVLRAYSGGGVKITGTNSGNSNTPHACVIRNSGGAVSCPVQVSCNSGEILTGGGCGSNAALIDNNPLSSTQWNCNGGGNCIAFAICCQY